MNATRISDLRKARGWTQERLARESGVTVRTVQRMEAGNDASLETVSLVAAALQVPVRDLFATVESTSYDTALGGLEERTAQQEQRNELDRQVKRARNVIGIVVSVAVLLLIGRGPVSGWMIFVIPVYWFVARWLVGRVVRAWLDGKYPLSEADAHPSKS